MADEELGVVPSQVEVMLALSRMEGQLSAFIQMMTSQGESIGVLSTDVGGLRDRVVKVEAAQIETVGLRDRVVAMESTRKATPPWWTWVAVVVPTVAFLLSFAKDLYAK